MFDYYVEKSIYSESDRKIRAQFIEKLREIWKNLDFETVILIEDNMGVKQNVTRDEFLFDKMAAEYLDKLVLLLSSYEKKVYAAGGLLLRIEELRNSSSSYRDTKEIRKKLDDMYFEIECMIRSSSEEEMNQLLLKMNEKEEKYIKKILEE